MVTVGDAGSLAIKMGENPRSPRTMFLSATSGLSSVNQQTQGGYNGNSSM